MSEAAAEDTGREIWIEKYRPQSLDSVVGHDDITARLRRYIAEEDLPHLLFAGPAGTGKTTSSTAIAREIYGEDWREHFLELNASDERGIDVVRDRIKSFAVPPKAARAKLLIRSLTTSMPRSSEAFSSRKCSRHSSP